MKLMNYIRVGYRAPLALLWTLITHFCFIRPSQILGTSKRALWSTKIWGIGLSFIMGIRIHKVNECPTPLGDVIISNHMGFLDIPIMLSCFPAVFVIKAEMTKAFFFGKALIKQGHVFVERGSMSSRRKASEELIQVLKDGDRIVVFPEGRASPKAKRPPFKPFSFAAVQQLDKRIQLCAIDYLPDRSMLEWDVRKSTFVQLAGLLGRPRIDVSLEFFPAEKVEDPRQMAKDYHALIQGRLEAHDQEREAGAAVSG
jgi:1-acyl-sn-glycerol-3-phosphate acyltransferase